MYTIPMQNQNIVFEKIITHQNKNNLDGILIFNNTELLV